MRKTKIVCTIGPACGSEEMMKKMMLAGMNVARLNLSHVTQKDHKEKIDLIKRLRKELGIPVAILLDTKGPEIRTGQLEGGEAELVSGKEVILTTEEITGNAEKVHINYKNLPKSLSRGNTIMVDDGLIELRVKEVGETEIKCDIISGAVLKNSKSVNVPGIPIDMPYISEKDKSDILFGIENDVDFFALSFVRTPQDVKDVRRILHSHGNYNIELIAKIENAEGVDNINGIINISDGIMVARGDMAVEIPFEELPRIQKDIITGCYSSGKKVITATQMLESMIHNPRPTRAEITDVANAIYDGTSAIMLSGETSVGAYPLRTVETMSKIAERTESHIDYKNYGMKNNRMEVNITNAMSDATCRAAHDLGAAAIVAVTLRGSSARMISRFRPETPIIAVTPYEKTYMKLALSWGITPVMNEYLENPQALFDDVLRRITERKLVKDGDIVVITGSTQNSVGSTNALQAHIVGNILLKGKGNGAEGASGRVYVVRDEEKDFHDFKAGDILVVMRTTNDILHMMRQCAGIITEENENDSGIVAAGYALDIPVISNAKSATSMLRTGANLRIDAKNGYVYNSDSSDETDA
ncbi:MAG: pyruvate kinase [Oscillospiraceae bacterium]|nr:pyruvate kinase [Oscillospiraceae bacterium]